MEQKPPTRPSTRAVASTIVAVITTFGLFTNGHWVAGTLMVLVTIVIALSSAPTARPTEEQASLLRVASEDLKAANQRALDLQTQLANLNAAYERAVDAQTKLASVDLKAANQRALDLQTQLANVAERYLNTVVELACERMTATGLERGQKSFEKAVDWLRAKAGIRVEAGLASMRSTIESGHLLALQKHGAKEEQARMKEEMREEARAEKERAKALADAERAAADAHQREAEIQSAIDNARKDAMVLVGLERAAADEKVAALQAQLAAAEAQIQEAERVKSQAQLTRKGYVYIISNLGSFGDNVYKVGMTRRLVPQERVDELGDASVPFEFDVHAMIGTDDAPDLEMRLHRDLHQFRMNKVNLRKEFFRVPLSDISAAIERNHGTVTLLAEQKAEEYRLSIEKAQSGAPDPYIPELDTAIGDE